MRLAVTVHTINSYLTQITSPRIAIGYQAGLVLKFHPSVSGILNPLVGNESRILGSASVELEPENSQ